MNFYMLHMCANSYEQCQNHQKSSCTCLHVNNCFFDGFDRATARDREGAKRHRGTQVLLVARKSDSPRPRGCKAPSRYASTARS